MYYGTQQSPGGALTPRGVDDCEGVAVSELIRPGTKGARWDLPRDGVEYLLCSVKSGADWWDLDDEVAAIPGASTSMHGTGRAGTRSRRLSFTS